MSWTRPTVIGWLWLHRHDAPKQERCIRLWRAHIEETDPMTIAEVLVQRRGNLAARQYFLKRSGYVSEPATSAHSVSRGNCAHFERMVHPHLGHCTKAEPEPTSGLWDTDCRSCCWWLPSEQKHGARVHGQ
jgi:hypothetical protein